MEPRDFLRMNNLIEQKQKKPRVSGLLLFSDYPQAYIARCGVKIIRYNTSAEIQERKDMVNNPLTEEGCLYKLIYNTVAKVQEVVEVIPCTIAVPERVRYDRRRRKIATSVSFSSGGRYESILSRLSPKDC
jgi:predicted HTH transcriptional regulator